jgi:hypothetical protein
VKDKKRGSNVEEEDREGRMNNTEKDSKGD